MLAAATCLAQRVLAGQEVDSYLEFLKSGGSDYPLQTLKRPVDMTTAEPLETTLAVFAQLLTELEQLL